MMGGTNQKVPRSATRFKFNTAKAAAKIKHPKPINRNVVEDKGPTSYLSNQNGINEAPDQSRMSHPAGSTPRSIAAGYRF
jgi:hypothetical protein